MMAEKGGPGPSLVLAVGWWVLGCAALALFSGAGHYGALFWSLPTFGTLLLRPRARPERFGLSLRDARAQLLAAFCLLAFILPAYVLVRLTLDPLPSWNFPGWLWLGRRAFDDLFGTSLPEELFFRGYLLVALMDRWPGRKVAGRTLPVAALLLGALLFALPHLPVRGWHPAGLLTFFPGLLFGLAFWWKRSLLLPVLLHFGCNFTVYVLAGGG